MLLGRASLVVTKGWRIGLSLSRTIVNSHGGEITVEPNPDGGTIFRFTLRRADPEEIDVDLATEPV